MSKDEELLTEEEIADIIKKRKQRAKEIKEEIDEKKKRLRNLEKKY